MLPVTLSPKKKKRFDRLVKCLGHGGNERESSLVSYVEQNFMRGTMREVIGNYFVGNDGYDLPEDNLECKAEVERAINKYIELKEVNS